MTEDEDALRYEDLPPEVRASIEKSLDDGVYLHPRQKPRIDFHVIEAIIWRPGKPNELAQVIIKYCDKPMKLELDGHQFLIQPAP